MVMVNNFQLTENFNLQEFECTHAKHRHVKVKKELVNKLQKLRDELGQAMIVSSGYRCPERNEQVGGADQSQHLKGTAADIKLNNLNYDIEEIAEKAEEIGFSGIGLYNTFIHLDVREDGPARWDQRTQ